MGPRSGSPATETRARAVPHFRVFLHGSAAALFIILALGQAAPACWAASAETTHQVTVVVVPTSLSIADDIGSSSLKFNDPVAGAQSDPQTVQYRVAGNSFPSGALSGIVSVSMADPPEGIELKADVGTFTNNGTEGNILLHPTASGEQVIGTDPTPLAGKETTSGTQANILNGTLPVTWTAGAKQNLSADEYPVTLTVTLKDT